MRGYLKRLALAAFLTLPATTWAADFVFTGTGDYNNGANWTPPGPPSSTDRADIAGDKTVTLSSTPTNPVDTLYLGGNADGPSPNDNATSNTTGGGTLNQTGGDLTVNTWAVLGENSATGNHAANAGTGTYNLSGGSFTLNGTDNMAVGQGGTGVFNVSGNATVTINSIMNVGRWSGVTGDTGADQGRGNGTVVQGGNSTVTINGQAGMGNTRALNVGLQGDGSYTIKDNATLNAALDVDIGTENHSVGTLTQTGGTLNNTAGWFFLGHDAGSTGTYNLSGGAANIAGRFLIGGGGANGGGTGTFNQTGGTLTVGAMPGQPDAQVNVSDGPGGGTYNMSGGTLIANGSILVGEWNGANGTFNISGNANITTTDFGVGRNQAAADPTMVTTTGVVNQTGGTVTVMGTTTLGTDVGNNTNGKTTGTYNLSGGTLVLGTGGLILGGQGSFMDDQGNTVMTPGGVGIFNLKGTGVLEGSRSTFSIAQGAGSATAFNMTGGTLQNAAAINFPLNQQGGTLQPGDPGKPDMLTITGNGADAYTLGSGGTLKIEIASGKADQLVVMNGSATIGGLLNVLVSGKAPTHGASFLIVSSSESAGTFTNAPTEYASSQGLFKVTYSGTGVTLSGFSLPGDANEDGSVNFSDLLILAQNYGKTGTGTWQQGDFNQDKAVGFPDLLILAQHYGQNNLTAPGLTEVPEPAVAGLIGLGALAVLKRRRLV